MSGGLDISAMLDGLYLGSALGYKKSTGNEACPVHGKLEPYVNCDGSIGKWFDDSGKYVGKMFDKLSANSFVDALNGNLDIDGENYVALIPVDSTEDEYVILKVTEDENGDEVLLTIEDDEEFDRVADAFEDEFMSEIDHDASAEDAE